MPRWSAERRAAVAHAAAAPPRRARNRACRARHGGSRLSALHPLGFCRAVRPTQLGQHPAARTKELAPMVRHPDKTLDEDAMPHTSRGRRPRFRARRAAARDQHPVGVPPLLPEQTLPAAPPLLGRSGLFATPSSGRWCRRRPRRGCARSSNRSAPTAHSARRCALPKPPGRMRGSAPTPWQSLRNPPLLHRTNDTFTHSKAPRDRGALRQRVPVRSNNTGT